MLEHLVLSESVFDELDKADCKESLKFFVKYFWPVVEPKRAFRDNWHIDAICEHLTAITNGEITRLLINVPPGTMKSLLVNVFWPAWEWTSFPSLRYVCASYSHALTIRDNRRTRAIITSLQYQQFWGDKVILREDQNAKVRFDTTATGFKLATSVGGLGTGERGDRFNIDDPHNVGDAESDAVRESTLDWFSETVQNRLNDPVESAITCVMQRVHTKDVSGYILAKELGYEHLCLPMEFDRKRKCYTSIGFVDPRTEDKELLWPDLFTEDAVRKLERVLGSYAYSGQYQQTPVPRQGALFMVDKCQIVDIVPPLNKVVRGWDLASTVSKTAAYTAAVKMGITSSGQVVILHVDRFRGRPWEVEQKLVNLAEFDGPGVRIDIPQDPGQAGVAQKAAYTKLLHGYSFNFSPETGDKETRANPFAAQIESGNVLVLRAPWNDDYLEELRIFPAGEYKDQVDASSRAYFALLRGGNNQTTIVAPSIIS